MLCAPCGRTRFCVLLLRMGDFLVRMGIGFPRTNLPFRVPIAHYPIVSLLIQLTQPPNNRPVVEQHGERCWALSELSTQLSTLKEVTDLNQQCRMQAIYRQLDEEDRKTLTRVLQSGTSTRKIHQVLRQHGHRIDRNLLSLHRKGFCTCKDEQ